jgi:hypothetical protein
MKGFCNRQDNQVEQPQAVQQVPAVKPTPAVQPTPTVKPTPVKPTPVQSQAVMIITHDHGDHNHCNDHDIDSYFGKNVAKRFSDYRQIIHDKDDENEKLKEQMSTLNKENDKLKEDLKKFQLKIHELDAKIKNDEDEKNKSKCFPW